MARLGLEPNHCSAAMCTTFSAFEVFLRRKKETPYVESTSICLSLCNDLTVWQSFIHFIVAVFTERFRANMSIVKIVLLKSTVDLGG